MKELLHELLNWNIISLENNAQLKGLFGIKLVELIYEVAVVTPFDGHAAFLFLRGHTNSVRPGIDKETPIKYLLGFSLPQLHP
jgi:hypothetical protein